jgi:hypothetical protein
LHYNYFFSLGHNNLVPGNRVAEKEGFIFSRFQGSREETFRLKIQSGGRASKIQGDCIAINFLVWGIIILLRVIELRKKKGSYFPVFKGVEGKLLGLKFNPEAGRQSYSKIA